MPLTQDQQDRIGEVVKDILLSRINCCPKLDVAIRNAPFHSTIIEYFKEELGSLNIELPYLAAIANWLYELNASAGSGFESLAHILSGGYKKSFTKQFSLKVRESQAIQADKIIRELKSSSKTQNIKPNLKRENNLIFLINQNDKLVNAMDFTVDNYIETEHLIDAIELKSVRPNSGEGRGEKQKILYAKAALKLLHPEKEIKFFVGFPFDPTSKEATSYDKERFFDYLIEFKRFFSPEEVLIASELWDHLSGSKNTMEEILEVISQTIRKIKENG